MRIQIDRYRIERSGAASRHLGHVDLQTMRRDRNGQIAVAPHCLVEAVIAPGLPVCKRNRQIVMAAASGHEERDLHRLASQIHTLRVALIIMGVPRQNCIGMIPALLQATSREASTAGLPPCPAAL